MEQHPNDWYDPLEESIVLDSVLLSNPNDTLYYLEKALQKAYDAGYEECQITYDKKD